ncbi:MAG: carbohydrate ABC transporter permease [Cellulosilyticaceae bacterium]
MKSRLVRKTKEEVIFEIVNIILLSIVIIIVLYPLIYVISASLSKPTHVLNGDIMLFPKEISFEAYKGVLENKSILTGYFNSIIIAVVGVLLSLVMTVCGAYPLSRRDLKGGKGIMLLITFTMFFSGGIIPTYLLMGKLNLLNSIWVLILPGAISTYNLIITRTYFMTAIPFEMQEAAMIDGCSNVGVLIKIILPLSAPILAVIGLYYLVGYWNAFFGAMMYITDRAKYPLQLVLREILIQSQTSAMMELDTTTLAEQAMRGEVIKYSVIVVSSLPMLIIYPFIQKFFVKGVMIGAVKG